MVVKCGTGPGCWSVVAPIVAKPRTTRTAVPTAVTGTRGRVLLVIVGTADPAGSGPQTGSTAPRQLVAGGSAAVGVGVTRHRRPPQG